MILPTIRASFDRGDALHLVELLGRHDPELRVAARARLEEDGVDALLDDPRVLNALLSETDVKVSPALVYYVLVRHALLEGGVEETSTADFVASMVLAFGRARRAYRISDDDDEEFHYLVDMLVRLSDAEERKAFLLRSHLGNYSLWLTGLFPDFLEARARRKGAPPLGYYERMGRTGYRLASETREAEGLGVREVLENVAHRFADLRRALNRVSDRYMWPGSGDPVGRLLREVQDRGPAGR